MPKSKSTPDDPPSDSASGKKTPTSPEKTKNQDVEVEAPKSNSNSAAPTPQSDVNVIEAIEEDEKNGDVAAAEKQPLKANEEKPSTSAAADAAIWDEEDAISKDDLDSDDVAIRKKGWDVRCVIIGLFILIVMVGGATAAILVHRFKGKPSYDFRFATYYGNHMVLQRAPYRATVWGHGRVLSDNTTVRLTVKGTSYEKEYYTLVRNTVSGPKWKVVLDAMTEHGPFSLTAELVGIEDQVVAIDDVLFGDVWVCAGQENMKEPIDQLSSADEEMLAADQYPSIRLFSVFSAKSDRLWYDLRGIELDWTLPGNASSDSSQMRRKFSSLCWLFGRKLHDQLNHPIGLIVSAYEDSMLQDWASLNVAKTCDVKLNYGTARIWNAMVNSLLDLSIYGLIWHQGESDASSKNEGTADYNCTLVEMFKEWRTELYARTLAATNPEFPIGIVQLPPFQPNSLDYGYPEVRWMQTANYGFTPNALLTNTFFTVTMDLPGGNATHGTQLTPHKGVVADRLIKGALAVGYERPGITYKGPWPVRYRVRRGDSLTLYYSGESIVTRDQKGFEVCCSDNRSLICLSSFIEASYAPNRKWEEAAIKSQTGNSVTLSLAECSREKHVVGVRYAWRESPCSLKECAVYGRDSDLPMPPFIKMPLTDDGNTHDIPEQQVNLL